jgi:hypothetical protein
MMDPATASKLAAQTLTLLAAHTPWLAEKVGGAAVTQAVRETWELVKSKLTSSHEGKEALAGLESAPSSQAVESLQQPLVAALQSDADFAERLSRLVVMGSDNQVAAGDNIKQAKVSGSSDVNINIG